MDNFNELVAHIAKFLRKMLTAFQNVIGNIDGIGNLFDTAKQTWNDTKSKPIDEE